MAMFEIPAQSGPSAQEAAFAEIRFFGRVSDTFGSSALLAIPAEGCRLSELMASLCELHEDGVEALTERGLRPLVGDEQVVGDVWIRPGQLVAFVSSVWAPAGAQRGSAPQA